MPDLTFAIKSQNETGAGLSSVKQDLDDVGESADSSSGKLSGLLGSLGGVAAMAGGIAAVGGAFAFAKGSIDDVDSLAESVEKLSAATGLAPEKASELEFAFSQMGVSSDQAQTMLDKFSKGLNGLTVNADGTTTKSSALTDQLKAMGISLTDAQGNAEPMDQIMGQLADKFQTMPDGVAKTTLATQLFGRSGVDLIPFLDKGSAGLQDLMKQSDLLGTTLSGSTLDAVHKNEQAQREFGAALEGVKIQLGTALLPAMTTVLTGAVQLAEAFDSRVVPAIKQVAQWLITQLTPTFLQIQAALPGIIAAVVSFAESLGTKLLPIIQQVAQWLEQHRQVAMALGVALAALVAGPIALLIAGVVLVIKYWGDLTAAWNAILPVLTAIGSAFSAFFTAIMQEAKPLVDWVKGVFLPEFQQDISAVSQFFQQKLIPAIQAVVDFIRDHWTQIQALFQGPLDAVKAVVQATFDTIKNVVELALRVLGDIITAAMDLIHGDWSGAWAAVQDIPRAVWDAIKTQVGIDLTLLEGLLKAAWETLRADAQLGWDALKALVPIAWDGIKSAVSDGISGLGRLLQALPGQIVSWLGDLSSLLVDAGGKLISGFISGIKNAIGGVKDTLTGLGKDIVSWKGPPDYDLTLLVPAGQNTIQGYINGIQSRIPDVQSALSSITSMVTSTVQGGLSELSSVASGKGATGGPPPGTPSYTYAGVGTALPGGGFSGGLQNTTTGALFAPGAMLAPGGGFTNWNGVAGSPVGPDPLTDTSRGLPAVASNTQKLPAVSDHTKSLATDSSTNVPVFKATSDASVSSANSLIDIQSQLLQQTPLLQQLASQGGSAGGGASAASANYAFSVGAPAGAVPAELMAGANPALLLARLRTIQEYAQFGQLPPGEAGQIAAIGSYEQLPNRQTGGGSGINITIQALDAAGVQSAMPEVVRQLQLYAQRLGGQGIAGLSKVGG